ncbi:hypothetical protein ACA910_005888 [Epithemia clementina (nom. ined.)]
MLVDRSVDAFIVDNFSQQMTSASTLASSHHCSIAERDGSQLDNILRLIPTQIWPLLPRQQRQQQKTPSPRTGRLSSLPTTTCLSAQSQDYNEQRSTHVAGGEIGLVPSRVLRSSIFSPTALKLAQIDQHTSQSETAAQQEHTEDADVRRSRRNRRRPPKKRKPKSTSINANGSNTMSVTSTQPQDNPINQQQVQQVQPKPVVEYPTTGHLPDPWYRAISMDHLRLHPQFRALSDIVTELQSLEEVCQFRQESWQWDALHRGRCTTSQAASALGFLEPCAATVLGIPSSWQRKGGHGAYHRMREQPALRTLEEMHSVLLTTETSGGRHNTMNAKVQSGSAKVVTADPIWAKPTNKSSFVSFSQSPFVADYMYQPTSDDFRQRKKYIKERSGGDYLEKGIRFIWGNTQEATALLTALNYFAALDPTVVLEESGLRGVGLDLQLTEIESSSSSSSSSLMIGATPDGVLRYGNGTIEVVEVKNHCPFYSNRGRKRHGGKVKAFSVGDRLFGLQDPSLPAQYVSQLQLEMLCLGPLCQSAIMVRQTATQGAVLLRMHRDNDWIDEMLFYLHRFQREFVDTDTPPPQDFFWNESKKGHSADVAGSDASSTSRYRQFVHRTAQLAKEMEVVATIPNNLIQRVQGEAPFFLD